MSFRVTESGECVRQHFNPEDVSDGKPRVLKFRMINTREKSSKVGFRNFVVIGSYRYTTRDENLQTHISVCVEVAHLGSVLVKIFGPPSPPINFVHDLI